MPDTVTTIEDQALIKKVQLQLQSGALNLGDANRLLERCKELIPQAKEPEKQYLIKILKTIRNILKLYRDKPEEFSHSFTPPDGVQNQ